MSQGFIGGDELMGNQSASPSSWLTPNKDMNDNQDKLVSMKEESLKFAEVVDLLF